MKLLTEINKLSLLAFLLFLLFETSVFSESERKIIDASTEENLNTSMKAVQKTLTPNQQRKFEEAVGIIMFLEPDEKKYVGLERYLEKIHGKTGIEVIAEATEIVQRMEHKVKEQKTKKRPMNFQIGFLVKA
ncbi:MAG: DUF6694 family lipoprotein [Nitrospirales bacterium]